jgi:hypothetical protein
MGFLPVAHLQLEVAEAALQDGVGAIVEGGEGRHVADTFFLHETFYHGLLIVSFYHGFYL